MDYVLVIIFLLFEEVDLLNSTIVWSNIYKLISWNVTSYFLDKKTIFTMNNNTAIFRIKNPNKP